MIFCSRRVFLNVLTQLMDAPTLLNANYFLIDQNPPNQYVGINDIPRIDNDGGITYEPSLDFATPQSTSGMHRYFIHYSRVIDPSSFFGLTTASMMNDYSRPEEKFREHLTHVQTQIAVYQEIFQKKLEGNGLQILIMNSDSGVEKCGHMICSFLSELFGADITFIDPQYRPKTKGQLQYIGNKTYAEKYIRWLRDAIFRSHVQQMIDNVRFGDSLNNLMTLPIFNDPDIPIEDLFHAFNVLFPQDQLPPGNYTKEHLKQIIIGRLVNSNKGLKENQSLSNLGVDLYAFDQMIGQYDNAMEEDFSDIS